MRRLLRALQLISALLIAPAVAGAPRVVYTIDVESQALPLPEQVNAICTDGTACGLMEIARMLQQRGWAGTFFLNVYEHRRWGEPLMRDIAQDLQSLGQDVALHTHPQWAYDPARNAMFQYDLEEQTTIIRDGMRVLADWTGRPVVAHRAGDYSADTRTIDALQRNGIRIDSSLFFGHPRSRVATSGWPRNVPSLHGSVTEIPVTIYRRDEFPPLLNDVLAPVGTIRKIDADWFVDADEARAAIDAVADANIPIVVIFLHSFSLLHAPESAGLPVANRGARDNFRAILDRVRERNLEVLSMRDLAAMDEAVLVSPSAPDVIPTVKVQTGIHRYVWHRLRGATPGELTAWLTLTAILVATIILLAFRYRRTRR
jgi:peptidoglycan/xylan/chitin deacetylase (PgdA/CDA1 family)